MDYEFFKKALINEDKLLFDKLPKTNLHAHALLSSNREVFQKEFHRMMKPYNDFYEYEDFNQYIKDNLSDLIADKDKQMKLYELSILTAINDGVSVFDIGVDYKSVYRIFNGSISDYLQALFKLKSKYKDKINVNYDLAISRKSYRKKDYYLIKKLIESKLFHGIDLVGDELAKDPRCFRKLYRFAKRNNLVLKAHVGEYGSAKSIKKTIKTLNLDYVQHGINIIDDEKVMKYAKDKGIIFNVCISSNLILFKQLNFKNHPIRKMYDYGLKVTINTDDELIFNSSLFNEYLLLYKHKCFNCDELYEIYKNGFTMKGGNRMFEISFYDLGTVDEKEFTRVVCVCKYKDKFVFSYNKKRSGWEIPGGHIEEGETWQEAAKREMYEETGATKIKVTPVAIYKISTYGLLCYCEIEEMEELPKEYEMEKIMLADTLPADSELTFPDSSKLYFNKVMSSINE